VSAPHITVDKGHGRIERREIRVSSALKGYSDFPGLEQVAEIRKRSIRVKTGEVKESIQYVVTSLPAAAASPARLLELTRGHWGIENRLHRVQDDSFGEDRHVEHTHQGGRMLSLLRAAGLNLLRGRLFRWREADPMTVRAAQVWMAPLAVLLATGL